MKFYRVSILFSIDYEVAGELNQSLPSLPENITIGLENLDEFVNVNLAPMATEENIRTYLLTAELKAESEQIALDSTESHFIKIPGYKLKERSVRAIEAHLTEPPDPPNESLPIFETRVGIYTKHFTLEDLWKKLRLDDYDFKIDLNGSRPNEFIYTIRHIAENKDHAREVILYFIDVKLRSGEPKGDNYRILFAASYSPPDYPLPNSQVDNPES